MREFYQNNMYGQWRSGEKVSYELVQELIEEQNPHQEKSIFYFEEPKHAQAKYQLKINVETNHKEISFTTKVYVPKPEAREKFKDKSPFIVCMHPIMPRDYALRSGYAIVELDTYKIASDDCKHNGCFYELYPYGENEETQTGVLMAWAWGASKVLDAVYVGLGSQLKLDEKSAIITGVSRWGKATAVCGAFDERFTMTVPTCSGAGGLALNNFVSEGKTYNFEAIGGPAKYTYTQNEPLSCLQSEAERGWFNDRFLQYKTMQDIPYEQYNLPVMAASKDRYYLILAACMGEDWVNAPAMWECYKKANEVYLQLGLSDHLIVHFHKEGHAVIDEDMEIIVSYFNNMRYGIGDKPDMKELKTTIFEKK